MLNVFRSKIKIGSNLKFKIFGGITLGLCSTNQVVFGSGKDIYRRSFVTTKDPDALAEFYGGEGLMDVFCVFPFIHKFLMTTGWWDDNGGYHTYGLPFGSLVASMDFREKIGEGNTDKSTAFNKKEVFRDTIFGFQLWNLTTNFGFQKLSDGRIECYQHGENYEGVLFMRLVFQLKSIYDIWACERHINSIAFANENMEDQALAQSKNIPAQVFREILTRSK
jgi:hypothetical protein